VTVFMQSSKLTAPRPTWSAPLAAARSGLRKAPTF
jgi:hypothetical protein